MIDIHSYESFTWKTMWLWHLPILLSPQAYPNAVTVHQCSKMPQIDYVPSLCYIVLPVTPHTMCTKHNTPQSLSPSLPHPSPLVTTSSFLESLSLLLFCSFSFASLLYSTNEGNHLTLVFLCWLISLSIIFSSSIHVAANGRISFFLMAE